MLARLALPARIRANPHSYKRGLLLGQLRMGDSEIERADEKTVERFNSRYGNRQRMLGFLGTAEGAAIAAQYVDRLASLPGERSVGRQHLSDRMS
jgi:hypothetical protein